MGVGEADADFPGTETERVGAESDTETVSEVVYVNESIPVGVNDNDRLGVLDGESVISSDGDGEGVSVEVGSDEPDNVSDGIIVIVRGKRSVTVFLLVSVADT